MNNGILRIGDTVKMLTTSSRYHNHGDIVKVNHIKYVWIGSDTYGHNTQYVTVGDDPGYWLHSCFKLVKPVVQLDEELFHV